MVTIELEETGICKIAPVAIARSIEVGGIKVIKITRDGNVIYPPSATQKAEK